MSILSPSLTNLLNQLGGNPAVAAPSAQMVQTVPTVLGTSHGATGDWGTPPPAPAPKAQPKTTITISNEPQPTAQTNQPSAPAAPNDDEIQKQIDSMYNQANQYLDAAQTNLSSQREVQQAALDLSKKQQLQDLTNSTAEQDKLAEQNKQQLFDTRQSAYAEAIRNYNNLNQAAQNRWGYSNSTGLAINDILGQELLRNQGNVQSAYMKGLQEVLNQNSKVHATAAQYQQKLDDDYNLKIQQLNQSFKDGLLQISAQRTTNEMQKAAKKVELMQAAIENAQQLKNQKYYSELALDQWRQQAAITMGYNLAALQQQTSDLGQSALGDAAIESSDYADDYSTLGGYYAPNSPLAYKPNNSSNDEYAALVNPWA